MSLGSYTKEELHKIVDIYNLGLKIKDLNVAKKELIKDMSKVGRKKLAGDLPTKSQLKDHKKKPLETIAKGTKDISSFFKKKSKEEKKKREKVNPSKELKEKAIDRIRKNRGREPTAKEKEIAIKNLTAKLNNPPKIKGKAKK
tara:strand:- start:36 stop:464 length:429 start_codon:yes stop_codon:yes gene_type:complete